jgi:hypothetical protein
MNAQNAANHQADIDNPFGYTIDAANGTKRKYVAKNYLRDLKIPFNITKVVERKGTSAQYGDKHEFVLTVEFVDPNEKELVEKLFSYSVGNPKGETTRRDLGTRAIMAGLAMSPPKRYDNFYIMGFGAAYTLTPVRPVDRDGETE